MTNFFGFPNVVEWFRAILLWILPLYKILGVPLGFAIVCSGCDFKPMFSPESKNEISYSPWSGFKATNSADTDMLVEDLKFDRDPQTGKVIGIAAKKVQFQSQQSKTDAQRERLMDRYDTMLQHAYAGRNEGWQIAGQNFVSGVNALGQFAPLVGGLVASQQQIEMAKVNKSQMLQQGIIGIASGQLDGAALLQQMNKLPPGFEDVQAKLAAFVKSQQVTTSQPSGGG